VLQTGRSRLWFPMVSMEFFIHIILLVCAVVLISAQPLTKISTSNTAKEIKAVSARADSFTTFKDRFSWNMLTSYFRILRACPGLSTDCFTFTNQMQTTKRRYL
jgi:hypothetical protein